MKLFHQKSRQWIITATLLLVCAGVVLAATTAQLLKDGYFVSTGAITPTANGVPVGNGTSFAVISAGASNTTFLRGDSTWATPAASGGLPILSSGAGTPTILNSSSSTITGAGNTVIFANTAAAGTLTSGTGNTILGNAADVGALSAANSVAVGNTAIAPTGGTVVGNAAGKASATAARLTAIGNTAGNAITSGADNVFVGDQAGKAVTTAPQCTFVGSSAGAAMVSTASANCSFFGYFTGNATTGAGNTFIGANSGKVNTSGTNNVCVGDGTGILMSTSTDVGNTFIGHLSGNHANASAFSPANNTGCGVSSLSAVTTGNNNTALGANAGAAIQTGDGNVIVGSQSDVNANSTNYAIVIGAGGGANQLKGSTGSVLIAANNVALNSATTNDLYIGSGDTGLNRVAAGVIGANTGNGGTTAADFSAQKSLLTAGTLTATNTALLRPCVSRYDWTNAMVTALGAVLAGDVTVCTLPAKTVVVNAYVVIDTAAGGVTTLTVACGRTSAGYIDYIVASDAKAGANTVYGDTSSERGTNLTGYDIPSVTGTTAVNIHFISTGANLSSVTTSTGHVYLETYTLP